MADEEFVVNRQDVEEIVRLMNAVTRAVIEAKSYAEIAPYKWFNMLLGYPGIPDFLDVSPSVSRDLFHMLKTWYDGETEDIRRVELNMRVALEFLTRMHGILGRALWGAAACKAGEYPEWWRNLLLELLPEDLSDEERDLYRGMVGEEGIKVE